MDIGQNSEMSWISNLEIFYVLFIPRYIVVGSGTTEKIDIGQCVVCSGTRRVGKIDVKVENR